MVAFGTAWYPDDRGTAAILSALSRLAPVKVIMKGPSPGQRPLSAECKGILGNATNIVMVPWLPQASVGCRGRLWTAR